MMRRTALLGLTCLLAGCQFAGNPLDGGGTFLYNTHLFNPNPNLPAGQEETTQRVEGRDVTVPPLLPEPGDIWPGPMQPIPSAQELQQQNLQQLPPPYVPAAPPPTLFPETPPPPAPASPSGTAPHAPATGDIGTSGVHSVTMPGGGQGVLVPNGNGTSTLIGPDGSMQIVPTPK